MKILTYEMIINERFNMIGLVNMVGIVVSQTTPECR